MDFIQFPLKYNESLAYLIKSVKEGLEDLVVYKW